MAALSEIEIKKIPGLSPNAIKKLKAEGHHTLGDISRIELSHEIYNLIGFEQAKVLLRALIKNGGAAKFSKPDWSENDWANFVKKLVEDEIVTWNEIAMAVCGELNPPQVGTAIASNASFQAKFPKRETMKNVMEWFYRQSGKCVRCGTRLFLEADHIRSKQEFRENGEAESNADTLDNLQLLCKRCNVIKRPSHDLGGISFAPAQSVLMWILLHLHPASKEEFYRLCREHGLTMANIRFDEAWAFAEWLKREQKY
ncbi:MAG: HNH endonuclease signature motif containing protein [Terricaulis sp.]